MITKESGLFDLTRLSRLDCINWQLSINLKLPRDKDTYFSMLVGMHDKSDWTSAIALIMWCAS